MAEAVRPRVTQSESRRTQAQATSTHSLCNEAQCHDDDRENFETALFGNFLGRRHDIAPRCIRNAWMSPALVSGVIRSASLGAGRPQPSAQPGVDRIMP